MSLDGLSCAFMIRRKTSEERDLATLEAIGRIYCRAHHQGQNPHKNLDTHRNLDPAIPREPHSNNKLDTSSNQDVQKDAADLCPSCREAIMSTLERASSCPNGHSGNCQDCSIKCQRGESQKRIKEIMRYSAPRMAIRHPLMTIEYLRKKFRHAGP